MERVILVTVDLGIKAGWTAEERSSELAELARSAGASPAREIIANRHAPDPACFIGKGKAAEIAAIRSNESAAAVIFNNDLSGTQQKNLESIIGGKVLDRTQLILDIFARHARSNEGKLQVELAQLMYMLPRLTGKGVEMSRLGGGIGTRGPGEKKLETDRRRIRDRISRLKRALDDLSRRRAMMRRHREHFAFMTVAIIGYTNAGKSTLLNALTRSDVLVQDKLFSTLDPTARAFSMPNGRKALLVDTVGFLNELPHHLIEAFNATLEEVSEADLLLHVIDVSHPKAIQQAESVENVLQEIGARSVAVVTVLNKSDRIKDRAVLERAASYFRGAVVISALNKEGLDDLIAKICVRMENSPGALSGPTFLA